MMKGILTTILLVAFVGLAAPAWSYDAAMAESYAELFAPVKGPGAGKALHMMKPDAFLKKVKSQAPLVTLDMRTAAEMGVFGMTLPGSLAIPLDELFTRANLDLIPTDKTVVIVCQSGTRAVAAGTALRHIGFDNVYVLKGGLKALSTYMGAKEANMPLKPSPSRT